MKMTLISTIILSLLSFCFGQITNASEDDKNRWNKRYNTGEYLYGKKPLKFLKDKLNILVRGKALVLAMGEGRNAVFLAGNGFDVDGCDISEKAVEKARLFFSGRRCGIECICS